MVTKVSEFLSSPVALGYLAIGLITLFVLAKTFMPAKANTIEKIEGFVYKAFNFAEKAIPDGVTGDTPVVKAMAKADTFLKKFCELYEQQHGTTPTDKEKSTAVTMAEKLVFTKNLS